MIVVLMGAYEQVQMAAAVLLNFIHNVLHGRSCIDHA